jgi:DNA modification methylase
VFREKANVEDKKLFSHPTIKPIKFIKNMIINSSNECDIVADFFLGSGTTCVAAKELKRNYIGFEIDKEYFEIAKKRLNNETANGQFMLDLFS